METWKGQGKKVRRPTLNMIFFPFYYPAPVMEFWDHFQTDGLPKKMELGQYNYTTLHYTGMGTRKNY